MAEVLVEALSEDIDESTLFLVLCRACSCLKTEEKSLCHARDRANLLSKSLQGR